MSALVEFALANHANPFEPVWLNPSEVVGVTRRIRRTHDRTTGQTTSEPLDDQTVIALRRALTPGSDPQVIVHGSPSEVARKLNRAAPGGKARN